MIIRVIVSLLGHLRLPLFVNSRYTWHSSGIRRSSAPDLHSILFNEYLATKFCAGVVAVVVLFRAYIDDLYIDEHK